MDKRQTSRAHQVLKDLYIFFEEPSKLQKKRKQYIQKLASKYRMTNKQLEIRESQTIDQFEVLKTSEKPAHKLVEGEDFIRKKQSVDKWLLVPHPGMIFYYH